MSDIRINGQRVPALSNISNLGQIITKIEALAKKSNKYLTSVSINGTDFDFENFDVHQMSLAPSEILEFKLETASQLAFESLQVAIEMVELLIFDLKVATLSVWENSSQSQKNLTTLIKDTKLFLSIAARPSEILGKSIDSLSSKSIKCLTILDEIAQSVEDSVLLFSNGYHKETCQILLIRMLEMLEKWMGLVPAFSEDLQVSQTTTDQNQPFQAQILG